MEALIDANGNRTRSGMCRGRVTREIRADNTTDTLYTYDLSGRLKTITDPKDQVTTHSYNTDDSLSGTGYTNEQVATGLDPVWWTVSERRIRYPQWQTRDAGDGARFTDEFKQQPVLCGDRSGKAVTKDSVSV